MLAVPVADLLHHNQQQPMWWYILVDSWAVQELSNLAFSQTALSSRLRSLQQKQLVDKLQAYKLANPIAETLPIFDVVGLPGNA